MRSTTHITLVRGGYLLLLTCLLSGCARQQILSPYGYQSLSILGKILLAFEHVVFRSPDTPIKVRGGSTTFYLHRSGKWISTHKAAEYCADSAANPISFEGFTDLSGQSVTTAGVPTLPWNITLADSFGKDLAKLSGSSGNCSGTSTVGEHVILALVNIKSRNERLYPGPVVKSSSKYEDSLRIRRRKNACTGIVQYTLPVPADPSDTSDDAVDEDGCERIGSMVVQLAQNSVSTYNCLDLDCGIYIGTPLP